MELKLHSIFENYELLDCGNGEKLERFNNVVLIRPEISAKNIPFLSSKDWLNIAHARFVEQNKTSGTWIFYKKLNFDSKFYINFKNDKININCNLFFSQSKHIGIFPEQVINWNFITNYYSDKEKIDALNLFAYTGASSLALSPFCNQITHVDSIKKIVDIAKTNSLSSNIGNIRFIVEHAVTFVQRELKRNKKYSCIVLDPPPIGVGTKGEKWVFSSMIELLFQNLQQILEDHSIILMNFYLHSFPEEKFLDICRKSFPRHKIIFFDKVFGLSEHGNKIDHGFFLRMES